MSRFRTNRRVWFAISLVLFIVPWFVPMIELNPRMAPTRLWLALFAPVLGHMTDVLVFLGWFIVLFGLPAIALGWVLQCLVVMVRAGTKNNETGG
jgi:hypothetical protein